MAGSSIEKYCKTAKGSKLFSLLPNCLSEFISRRAFKDPRRSIAYNGADPPRVLYHE